MGKGVGRIGGLLIDDLNELKDGLGTKFAQELNSRFDRISARLEEQTGRSGTVSIAKQDQGPGLDLNSQRISGVATPKQNSDLINLRELRKHNTCDWFAQMAEDCLQLPREQVTIATGTSAWVFSSVIATEIYVYPGSQFVLLHSLNRTFPNPPYTLAVIEMPELAIGAPITLRGTYTAATTGADCASTWMVDEARGVVYGGTGEQVLGGSGNVWAATIFNVFRISDVDNLQLIQSVLVLFVDGEPGDPGVSRHFINGASGYGNGKALVFGQRPIEALPPGTYFYKANIPDPHSPITTAIYSFNDIAGGAPPGGPVKVVIGSDIAYVFWNAGDDPGSGAYYLYALSIIGNADVPPTLASVQVIHGDVPNADSSFSVGMQISGNKLHVLHMAWANPPGVQLESHWKIYDITNPALPVLLSDTMSPCNMWIGMYVDGDCVMLTEQFAGATSGQTATLWDASDPTHPRLIGGCLQHETPERQSRMDHFLRDSRGYYLTGLGGRFVIQDFIGHGVTC